MFNLRENCKGAKAQDTLSPKYITKHLIYLFICIYICIFFDIFIKQAGTSSPLSNPPTCGEGGLKSHLVGKT